MGIDDKIDLKGWEKIDDYSEELGIENDQVRVEFKDGKTIRTFVEYNVIVYGSVYQKGNEIKKVEERRERHRIRQYDSENFVGTLTFR